jgi:hypothetical protein
MRGPRRERLLLAGKIFLVASLATSAVFATASGRLGWTNYWGGFVYAPFALIIAMLFAVLLSKKGNRKVDQVRRRSR